MAPPTEEQLNTIKTLANTWAHSIRLPLIRKPDELSMPYKSIKIPSFDGVRLDAWYIPKEGSSQLIICNHPMMFNKYGCPGHLDEYKAMSDFEVSFIPEYKALHDAGYNVLAYDFRNHGESAKGDGGICGIGRHEWKDCVGVKQWVDQHPELSKMTVGLNSRCMGANSQFEAISRFPQLFANVKALVAPQPVTLTCLVPKFLQQVGLGEFQDYFDNEKRKLGSLGTAESDPKLFTLNVKIPTLLSQVHHDTWSVPEDMEQIFESLGSKEKKLLWIEGTTRRFGGYNYFVEHPEEMLEWYKRYM